MSNNNKDHNSLIKSIKSESPEQKDEQNNEILVDQPPQSFNALIKKDINFLQNENKEDKIINTNNNNNANKSINKGNNIIKKEENQQNENEGENENIEGNIILIDNKNNDDPLEFNLNIDFEQHNKIKENKNDDNNKNNELKNSENKNNNLEKSLSERKNKYFDDINNSSIVRKEESNIEYNTNKKSQNSDSARFKIMIEMGNKNSIPKIKTLESLDKLNPFTSINSQNTGHLNRHEEIKNSNVLKSISEPEIEEDEKSNEDNINNNNYKIKKKLSDDINFKIPEENNRDKNTVISKDIITTSNNDLNEACIKTNENLKSKFENSDFIEHNKGKNGKNNNNEMNKINIEFFFKPNESKNKDVFIEETKKDIINDISNLYKENKLNLVKLNNHEIYTFITDYNNITKDSLEYEPDYYILSNKDNDFILRRNNFLSHNYFSYITKKKLNNDNLDIKLKKYKKNYNEKIPKLTINDSNINQKSSIRLSKDKDKNKIIKINDIENISSFFYNFGFYSPETKNKKILDEKSENEIIKIITTYRKIYNDGNSFQRAFSYLLFENFLLKNQINNINYIIYDIKKTLSQKYLDIDNAINILINIKESYSIDNLMNCFNNPNMNIDEIMISYIEDIINKINKIDIINKRKYQEINMNYLKTLSNIFDINFEIFYIEENKTKKNNNYLLSMNQINIYCNSEKNTNNINNERISDSDEYETIPTFHFLFFLNSFHIVYTKKSDIDTTLANNEYSRQHYYLHSLPKYNCPKCNKNTPLDIITYYEIVLCHKCLIIYMKEILKNRVLSFIKSNFSSIEYFTRPITIKSDIKISFTLYKYITGNYLIQDFEHILENICFVCFKYFYNNKNNNKIIKLKCQCQLCQNCLEEKIKENMGGYKYLNLYEIHTKHFSKCPCDNMYNITELLKYTKIKPSEKDKKEALQRLINILEEKCCVCLAVKDKIEYIKLIVANSQPHFICMDCYPKNIFDPKNNKNANKKYGNNLNKNKKIYHDLESSNSSLKVNDTDKRFFCNICNTEHIILPDVDNFPKKQKNKITKCCEKCNIY